MKNIHLLNNYQLFFEVCNGNYYQLKLNALDGFPYHGYHWLIEGQEIELKEKRVSNFKGKHLSKETKKKLSESKSEAVKCLETGQIFNSLKEASLWLGNSATGFYIKERALKKKEYKGYHWELIPKEKNEKTITISETMKKGKKGIKIKCIEANKIFNTLTMAAKWLEISVAAASKYLKKSIIDGTAYKGYHWELI